MKYLSLIVCVFTLALFTGCGSQKTETKYKGVKATNDYIAKGMQLLSDGKVPDAIVAFNAAIRQEPSNPENYIVLGQVYMRLKNYDGAIKAFEAASKVAPDNGEAYYLMAMTKMISGDKDGAIISAEKSVNAFMQKRDEEKFKQAVALLRNLSDEGTSLPVQVADQNNLKKK